MRLATLRLDRYGPFLDTAVPLGPRLTLVVGPNEAGKSTLLEALADLIWGIPHRPRLADLVPRAQIRVTADLLVPAGTDDGPEDRPLRLDRTGRGLFPDGSTEPYPNPWGQDGEDRRRWWLGRFGLDQAALRAGGREVCAGSGDLAELVFTARSGQGVHQILDDLTHQADQLYKEHRGNKAVRIRQAAQEVRARDEAAGRAVVRSGEVVRAGERVRELNAQRERAATAETEAARLVEALAERRRCLDDAHRLREVRTELAAVLAEGPHLEETAIAVHEECRKTLVDADRLRSDLAERLGRLREERDALRVDHALLADSEELETLHAGIVARAADRERAVLLADEATEHDRTAQDQLTALLGRPDPRDPATLLAELEVPVDLAVQLDRAAADHQTVLATLESARSRVREEQEAVAGVPAVPPLPEREAMAPLDQLVTALDREDSPLHRLRAALAEATAHRTGCRRALVEAGAPDAGIRPPRPPAAAEVEEEIRKLSAARNAEDLAVTRLTEAETEQATAQDALAAAAEADVADPALLPVLRTRRDALWSRVCRAWLGPDPDSSQADGPQADDPADTTASGARVLARCYAEAVRDGDSLADRLRTDADRVALLARLRSDRDRAVAVVERRRVDLDRAATERAERENAWTARWTALGVPVPETTGAPTVRLALATAVTEAIRAEECQAQVAVITAELRTWSGRLARLLGDLGRRPETEPGPGTADGLRDTPQPATDTDTDDTGPALAEADLLLDTARRLRAEVDAARELRQQHQSAGRALDLARSRHAEAEDALESWHSAWVGMVAAAGLSPATDPTGWAARRTTTARAREARDRAELLRAEAATLHRAWEDVASRVTVLAERHGVSGSSEKALEVLWQQLARSREDHRMHDERVRAVITTTSELDHQQERVDATNHRLAELGNRHGLDDDGLLRAAERGRRVAELQSRERALVDLVRAAVGAGHDVESVVSAAVATDAAELRVQQELAEAELVRARASREQAVQDRGAALRELERLEQAGDAAQLNARTQEALAELAELTERYAILHLQRLVLRQQLEEDARRHASPMLDQAGRLLERLTSGRWVALRAHDDGAGNRSLEVVRGDGEPHKATALSEGTADQVFLALRLAGIAQAQRERIRSAQNPLPIILDDVLMAFDDERSVAALQVLADLSGSLPGGYQIVLFTHHRHLGDLARDLRRDDVSVTRLANPEPLSGNNRADRVRGHR